MNPLERKYTDFNNFCPCGINATGEEPAPEPIPEESANKKVINLRAWQYVRAGLAIVGAYVVIKYLITKFKK